MKRIFRGFPKLILLSPYGHKNYENRKAGKRFELLTLPVFLRSLFTVAPEFLVSWLPNSILLLPLMHQQFVPVGIPKLRHETNWRFIFLVFECDAARF